MAGRLSNFRAGNRGGRAEPPPPSGGDRERFRVLVLPHLDAAYNFARYLCRDGPAAEDIVHDAFLRAWRGFGGFRGDNPKAWLFAIVRNLVFTSARAARTQAEVFDFDAATGAVERQSEPEVQAADERMIRSAEIQAVRAAIESLPEPFRETLVLRELEELSYREVADVVGAPIGTVMSRLARARKMLVTALSGPEEMRA